MAIAITLLLSTVCDQAMKRFRPNLALRWGAEAATNAISRWLRLSVQRGFLLSVLLPILALATLTAVFRLTNADVEVCRLFYGGSHNAWPLGDGDLCVFVYDYSSFPGLVLGIGGLIVGIASLICSRLRPYRKAGFFLAAMLAVGPGLVVNGIFKPYWCRPRPKETVEFGGSQQFAYVWSWDSVSTSKSFPCGHASMGFYLMAPAFLLYRRRGLALAFISAGLACGSVIGLARVVQGSHFPSDVVWSAGMTYLSGLSLCFLFDLEVPWFSAGGTTWPKQVHSRATETGAIEGLYPVVGAPLLVNEDGDRRKAA